MPNQLFRNRLVSHIKAAMVAFEQASLLAHPFLIGRVREIAIQDLIAPLLSPEFRVGTGKVSDHAGKLSSETDLIIYSSKMIPPILFSENLGLFPLDCCFAAIEIKSRLTKGELAGFVLNCRTLLELEYASGRFDREGTGTPHAVNAAIRALFAFGSDITGDEFARYKEVDPNWRDFPALDSFCVFGKGTWFWFPSKGTWNFVAPTEDHVEVIFFLTSIVNALTDALQSRGHPRIGTYLNVDSYEQL